MNKKSKRKKEEDVELPGKKAERSSVASVNHKWCLLPVIPYHISIYTGLERDASTTSRAFVIIIGANHTQTQRLWLDLPDGRKGFEAGSLERFEAHGSDVGEIKKVEVRGQEEEGAGKHVHVCAREL